MNSKLQCKEFQINALDDDDDEGMSPLFTRKLRKDNFTYLIWHSE